MSRPAGGAPGEPTGLEGDVEAARAGSVAAFERIYRTLAPSVASYLRWHGASDVGSITNEVFVQVHRRLESFSGDERGFRSWVFTIAHRRMVDDRRRTARRVAGPLVDPQTELSEVIDVADTEAEAMASLGDLRIRDLLASLSDEQRAVVLLRIVADLSVEDTARALGKRQGAVKALQHRAMAALRRQLEAAEQDVEGTGR